jgi:hypothetical protein
MPGGKARHASRTPSVKSRSNHGWVLACFDPQWPNLKYAVAYFDLILAASSARFCCHASYSGVPGRGGTSFGIPPSHVGTLSATTALTAGRGSVAHPDSIVQVMAISVDLAEANLIVTTSRLNLF